MPNGDEKNWGRTCAAIDGFRARYGCWPKRVRISEMCFTDLVGHVLKPEGFALVSTVIEIVLDSNLRYGMTAETDDGSSFHYGDGDAPDFNFSIDQTARDFFGSAILRQDLDFGLGSVTLCDSEGNPVKTNPAGTNETTPPRPRKKIGSNKTKSRRRGG